MEQNEYGLIDFNTKQNCRRHKEQNEYGLTEF